MIEHNDVLTGLLVDAVLGMQSFPVDREIPAGEVPEALSGFVTRSFDRDGRSWPVMQFTDLIESPDFLNIAV